MTTDSSQLRVAGRTTWLEAAAFFAFFFLVITAFWMLKPLRTSGVVKAFGAAYYPLVKTGLVVVLPVVVLGYSALVSRLRRPTLAKLLVGVFVSLAVGFFAWFRLAPGGAAQVAFFYFVDSYVTVMVALFWTYLNDSSTPEQARRVYGLVGAGGIVGGIVGTAVSGFLSEHLGDYIILVAAAALLPLFGIVSGIEALVARRGGAVVSEPTEAAAAPARGSALAEALEGFGAVARSPYLLSVVAIVGLYEIVSTILDYQFNETSSLAFTSRDAMGAYQGRVFFLVNWVALGLQVVVVPLLLRLRAGVLVALLVLPAASLLSSGGILLAPTLLLTSLAIGADGALSYSVNQTAKEILYTPLSRVEKYKAKAVVDMFVLRFAKTVAGAVLITYTLWLSRLGFDSSHLMALNLVLVALWTIAALTAAARFRRATEGGQGR